MTQRPTLTIGRLARAAGVGVETIRYYQQRGLLPVPDRVGSYRHYPLTLIQRIRFIKRAQELGFSLQDIGGLLSLEDGRDRQAIREIAAARLEQIEAKLADLGRMRSTLSHVLAQCAETDAAQPCPIIRSLSVAEQ